MRLPRDLSGTDLARLLRRFGYEVTRQTGSHIRLTSTLRGAQHHVSVPRHNELRVGTLSSVLNEIAGHLELGRDELLRRLLE